VYLLGITRLGTVASKRNQTLSIATDRSSFGARGLDTLMRKELFDEIATQCKSRTRTAPKSVTGNLMSHC
jgi:hypothetical protein